MTEPERKAVLHLRAGTVLVRRLLDLDPWQEEAHRPAMWLMAALGRRTEGLVQFERCRSLAEAFGVKPAKGTWALYRTIQAACLPDPALLGPGHA